MSISADGGQVTGGPRPARSRARLGAALVVAAAVVVPVYGLASSLNMTNRTLGDGSATVTSCDTDGVKVTPNITGTNVVSATIAGIASSCTNATLSVTVNNGLTNASGTGTVPTSGTMTVTLATAVAATDGMQSDLSISGP
jgi:hypothetical protein